MSTNLIEVEQVDDKFVHLVVIYNALDMREREEARLVFEEGKTLQDYMQGLPDPEMWSVSVNAEPYAPEDWGNVIPRENDYITVIPIPHGGGGDSKGVLRMVAMIAVTVVAPYASAAMLNTTVAAMGVGGAALSAGIATVGGVLVNALLPPAVASTNSPSDQSESPTYGIDGAKNTQTEDTVIPLVYGEFRVSGNLVNVKTENVDDTQIVYAQAVVSEGEIESITDFQIEEQPISNYEDVETVVRLGEADQSVVGWFADSVSMISKSNTLTTNWTTHTTVGEVDGLRLDVVFPQGLSNIDDKDGERKNRTVELEMQYRKVGDSSWTDLEAQQYRQLSDTTIPKKSGRLRVEYSQSFTGDATINVSGTIYIRRKGTSAWTEKETQTKTVLMHTGVGYLDGVFYVAMPSDAYSNEYEYKIEWQHASPDITASAYYEVSPSITAKTSQPLRRSFMTGVLPESRYEIRIRRTNDEAESDYAYDQVVLSDVAEIINERVRYNHTAFYGIKVRLTDQLSSLPEMSALVRGIKLNEYDRSGKWLRKRWSANPAWITLDMLTNKVYGGSLDISRIDIAMFVEWAEFCEENNLTFNATLDTFSNIWDGCQMVLRVGHARFITVGNVISVSLYRKSDPVMMFGTGNIIEGTLSLSWQALEERSNEFEIEYYDREDNNRQNTVRVVNEDALARGEVQRISTTRMIGIDNQTQALKEAHFQKALNEALVMSGSFDASVESLVCGVGDVVLLQHDMPEWGESGRTKPGSTRTDVIVDRPLTIGASPKSSSLMVIHPAILRATGTVSIVTSSTNTIYVTGVSASLKAKRLKKGSLDLLIRNLSSNGGYLEVTLEDASSIKVNDSVELWDTDVIESRTIASYTSATNTVKLSGPLSADPEDFTNYMVGTTNAVAKPVSITGISGDADHKRTISFIEYNETVFDPENVVETPIYTRPVTTVGQVRDLTVTEELTLQSGTLITDVIVMWTRPEDGNYAGAKVYASRNSGEMSQIGTASAGSTRYSTQAAIGEVIRFKVVAYDGAGRSASYTDAPVWIHTVEGASAPPASVEDFLVEKGLGGVEFTWKASTEIDVTGYEIREGGTWETGVPIVEDYAGNRFFTTKKKGGFYTYHIKAIDMLRNQSNEPTTAVLSLPAPSVVTGFTSVQNGDQIILQWRINPEVDVTGYEIRQGSSWANSKHVAHVSGTSLTVPAGASEAQSYLIKAYDSAGVESASAARVSQTIVRSQSYNAIYEVDATADNYGGNIIGMDRVSGRLESDGGEYSEYLQKLLLPKRYNAMVVTKEIVALKSSDKRTWADMNFSWRSTSAKTPWFPTDESDDLSLAKEITTYVGQESGDIAAWALDTTASTPDYGDGSLQSSNVSTNTTGRFGYGLYVNNTTSVLQANVDDEADTATWWVTYRGAGDQIGHLVGSKGEITIAIWGGSLRLTGAVSASVVSDVSLKNLYRYFVFAASIGGKVKVFVGCLETEDTVEIEATVDIGTLSAIKLA